jgi:hypothetical protein
MHDLGQLEEVYRKYITNLESLLPDGITSVDMPLLQRLSLLDAYGKDTQDYSFTHSFHYSESDEKITLVNDNFVVWIVPERIDEQMVTLTLVALNHPSKPRLELAFITTGVFNTSHLVLRILEKLLNEIQENEEMIEKME